jgi:hypothetical protein
MLYEYLPTVFFASAASMLLLMCVVILAAIGEPLWKWLNDDYSKCKYPVYTYLQDKIWPDVSAIYGCVLVIPIVFVILLSLLLDHYMIVIYAAIVVAGLFSIRALIRRTKT